MVSGSGYHGRDAHGCEIAYDASHDNLDDDVLGMWHSCGLGDAVIVGSTRERWCPVMEHDADGHGQNQTRSPMSCWSMLSVGCQQATCCLIDDVSPDKAEQMSNKTDWVSQVGN